jgi:hypothetical protein
MESIARFTNFERRLGRAEQFEREVEAYCQRSGKVEAVARNGTEHTHPDFVRLLRNRIDDGSKFVRFAPDGVALFKERGVIHWEAKASINIERDAYLTYMAYNKLGARVLVFIKPSSSSAVYYNYIERVQFTPSEEVVGRIRNVARRHPIDKDGWMCPRQGHGQAGNGSGTPYKEIDLTSLIQLSDFYPEAS